MARRRGHGAPRGRCHFSCARLWLVAGVAAGAARAALFIDDFNVECADKCQKGFDIGTSRLCVVFDGYGVGQGQAAVCVGESSMALGDATWGSNAPTQADQINAERNINITHPKIDFGVDFLIITAIKTSIFHTCVHLHGAAGATLRCFGGDGGSNQFEVASLGYGAAHVSAPPIDRDIAYGGVSTMLVLRYTLARNSTCLLNTNGNVYCFGSNARHQLGFADTAFTNAEVYEEVPIDSAAALVGVECGDYHCCAWNVDSEVYCWGDNRYGQLGRGEASLDSSPLPRKVDLFRADVHSNGTAHGAAVLIERLHCGGDFCCVLAQHWHLKCWGDNQYGQLGVGYIELDAFGGGAASSVGRLAAPGEYFIPSEYVQFSLILDASKVVDFDVGRHHACAIVSTGQLYCWGRGGNGRLGREPGHIWQEFVRTAPFVQGAADLKGNRATAVSAGEDATCVRLEGADNLLCFGNGMYGAMGNGGANYEYFLKGQEEYETASSVKMGGKVLAFTEECAQDCYNGGTVGGGGVGSDGTSSGGSGGGGGGGSSGGGGSGNDDGGGGAAAVAVAALLGALAMFALVAAVAAIWLVRRRRQSPRSAAAAGGGGGGGGGGGSDRVWVKSRSNSQYGQLVLRSTGGSALGNSRVGAGGGGGGGGSGVEGEGGATYKSLRLAPLSRSGSQRGLAKRRGGSFSGGGKGGDGLGGVGGGSGGSLGGSSSKRSRSYTGRSRSGTGGNNTTFLSTNNQRSRKMSKIAAPPTLANTNNNSNNNNNNNHHHNVNEYVYDHIQFLSSSDGGSSRDYRNDTILNRNNKLNNNNNNNNNNFYESPSQPFGAKDYDNVYDTLNRHTRKTRSTQQPSIVGGGRDNDTVVINLESNRGARGEGGGGGKGGDSGYLPIVNAYDKATETDAAPYDGINRPL